MKHSEDLKNELPLPPEDRRKRNPKAERRQAKLDRKLEGKDGERLEAILKRMGVKNWDFVLFGDGSGCHWDHPIGWACVSIHRGTSRYVPWFGMANYGTVNMAEIMAYVQPLTFIESREATRRENTGRTRAINVHIFTDSEYCQQTGSSNRRTLRRNSALWAMFDGFLRQGIILHWHWMRRETTAMNRYVDQLSKLARKLLVASDLPKMTAKLVGRPELLNPWKGQSE